MRQSNNKTNTLVKRDYYNNTQVEYRLPLFYRFNTDDDFVSKDIMLSSLSSSLQDLLSDFIRNVYPVDLKDLYINESPWCQGLSDFIAENEPRLIMPRVRVLAHARKLGVLEIEIIAKLCFDDSIYTLQLRT